VAKQAGRELDMDIDLQELRERVSQLDDDSLLRMIGEESDSYRPEALAVAREEVKRRGIDPNKRPIEVEDLDLASDEEPAEETEEEIEEVGEEQEQEQAPKPQRGFLCPSCGSGLRRALLLGETQVIAVFEPNREQPFVYAMVCPRCGTADLFVDFETEVDE